MAANNNPIFPLTPLAAWATFTAANTAKDGTGTTQTLLTAGANATYVDSIRAQPKGNCVASVLRVFLNNGNSSAVAANNSLFAEASLPLTTLTEVAAQDQVNITIGKAIPAGYKLIACIGTAVADGWQVTALAGDY